MARVMVSEFLTLDGVFEDPGGAEDTPFGGWSFRFDRSPEGDRFKFDELMAAEALLLGRVTYEGFAEGGRRLFAEAPERSFKTTAVQRAGDCTILILHPIGRT
jgi:dihydrofolate reductase